MRLGSYHPDDVTLLLTPVSLAPVPTAEKERQIQSGARHYSEMLADEAPPDPLFLAFYAAAVARDGPRTAARVAALAKSLQARAAGAEIVLASLARGGIPPGVLLARALRLLGARVAHYAISVVRDRGLDGAALDWILARHEARSLVFVDGWTGKGTIAAELRRSLADHPTVTPFLCVLADPAGVADLAATEADEIPPSGLLNGIVSGLVSRTLVRPDLAGEGAFHGAVPLDHLAPHDLTHAFVASVEAHLAAALQETPPAHWPPERRWAAAEATARLVAALGGDGRDRLLVKPGIGEATRALLRRVPEALYVRSEDDPETAHLLWLAANEGVPVRRLPGTGASARAACVVQRMGRD